MEYAKGAVNRVFAVRFDDKEDILSGIEDIVKRENIGFATILILGAVKKGKIVSGPEYDRLPPDPNWNFFSRTHEIIGGGTIVSDGNIVEPHIHIALGRADRSLTGCLRGVSEVFITVEAVITEVTGIEVARRKDEKTGIKLLRVKTAVK